MNRRNTREYNELRNEIVNLEMRVDEAIRRGDRNFIYGILFGSAMLAFVEYSLRVLFGG